VRPELRMRFPQVLMRIGAIAFGIAAALLGCEAGLRLFGIDPMLPESQELRQFREAGSAAREAWEVDPVMGFRPRLGYRPEEGRTVYSEYGTLPNSYPIEKRKGTDRILFIGDSVTARGKLVAAIQKRCGTPNQEFWNAGVESFNTRQEVEFYRRYNRRIKPDRVILTFHMNDFETTPVAFVDRNGQLMVWAPNHQVAQLSRVLFSHSYLYRLLAAVWMAGGSRSNAATADVRESLRELVSLTHGEARLTVLVFPLLKPWKEWSPEERLDHGRILRILATQRIRHIDLLPILEQGLASGITVREEARDTWHPSSEFADEIASSLCRSGLLESSETQSD
jgi:hypothetical protein